MRASSRAVTPPEGGRGGPASTTTNSSSTSSSSLLLRRLVPLLLLFVAAAVLPAPTRPSVMTDFFASRELGRGVQCGYSSSSSSKGENGSGHNKPATAAAVAEACSRAHSSAAAAASLSDFLGNSLALLVAPALGRASDASVVVVEGRGKNRKSLRAKYLSLALLSSALPPLALALHLSSPPLPLSPFSSLPAPLPPSFPPPPSPMLYLYFFFSALATAAPGAAICLAYAADALPAGARAPAFAAVSAAVSGGLLLGAGAGAFLRAGTAAWLATAGVVVSGVLALWLPEAQQQQQQQERRALEETATTARSTSAAKNTPTHSADPLSAFRLLTATPQAARLLACVVLSGAAAQGLSDTIAQFLQQRLSFGASDQALLLAIAGGGGVVCQAVVLPRLLSSGIVAAEPGLLRVGIAAALLEHLGLLFSSSKFAALSAVGVGALGGLAFPAASALASDAGGSGGQGAVQGALSAARSGAAAVGPLAFGGVYLFASRKLPESCAGAPFLLGSALLLAALVLSLKVVAPLPAAAAAASSSSSAERASFPRAEGEEFEADEEEAAPLMSSAETPLREDK